MQTFHIVKEIKPKKTYRVASVIDRYDLQYEHLKETFKGEIKLDESWKIGCIVGTSGTGKTTVAKEMFGNRLSEYVAKYYLEKGKRFLSITSSPSMLYSRQKSKNWKLKRFGRVNPMLKSGRVDVLSCDRFTSSWEYING